MTPDSQLVDLAEEGLGYSRGRLSERRSPTAAIVAHTTGVGVVDRATSRLAGRVRWRRRAGVHYGDAWLAAIAVYRGMMDASPHYVICGETGRLAQIVPEDRCAWHVGSRGALPYVRLRGRSRWMRGDRDEYQWWADRWPMLESPAQLAGGMLWEPYHGWPGWRQVTSGALRLSCNANTIGIEVVPRATEPRGPWTADAWETLARLCLDIAGRRGVPLRRDTVITHSDAHPLARTRRGRPWDPSPSQWSWERMRRVLRAFEPEPATNGPACEA